MKMYIGSTSNLGLASDISSLASAASASVSTASAATTSASSTSGSSNLLAGNFVNAASETSKYIEARLGAFQIQNSIENAQASSASSLLDAAGGLFFLKDDGGGGGDRKYVEGVLHKLKVDRLAKNQKNKEAIEHSEPVLEESRDQIEDAAQEATAPTDANGEPLPGTTDGSSDGVEALAPPDALDQTLDRPQNTVADASSAAQVDPQTTGQAAAQALSAYTAPLIGDLDLSSTLGAEVDISV
ncbi:hypothetical protein [Desulfocurvus sp. DL9XJH121]